MGPDPAWGAYSTPHTLAGVEETDFSFSKDPTPLSALWIIGLWALPPDPK